MKDTLDDLLTLIQEVSHLYTSDKRKVKEVIDAYPFDLASLDEFLEDPKGMPYGRRLLYNDGEVEVILMNWDINSKCLPHDHGESEGWVKVLKGSASHGYYSNYNIVPKLTNEELINEGAVIFAPKNLVHHMANKMENSLVTLHFYFPPISNMEVFDIDAARAAIVSSDCGAWWPESREQLFKSRSLKCE